jgi:FkbM family methyltransferase
MLEILLGPMVVKRVLPEAYGGSALYASAKVGGLKYLLKPFARLDPELVNIASLIIKENAVVWDVGANVGLFSVLSGALAGKHGAVIAFEADTDAAILLHRTAYLNRDRFSMSVVPIAISDKIGILKFAIAKRARASNAIEGFGHSQMGGVRETRMVPSFTLDGLLDAFRPPTVLKIDVEGAELDVLKGAVSVISEFKPIIYCEVSRSNAQAVARLLQEMGYKLFDASGFTGHADVEVHTACNNTVAIHSSFGSK